MTEKEARAKVVKLAESYMGARRGSRKHKAIIDEFNRVKPDGWAMTYTALWCAAFASAISIKAYGITKAKKYFPLSANCGTIIAKAKKMGIWKEADNYAGVKPGDWILYDWDDSGRGDNHGSPDHVGIVETANKNIIVAIEGNAGEPSAVRERRIARGGRFIRGFVAPNYTALAESSPKPKKKTVTQIAKEVIEGKWGNGEDRKKKLKAAGALVKEVSAISAFVPLDSDACAVVSGSPGRAAKKEFGTVKAAVPMVDFGFIPI